MVDVSLAVQMKIALDLGGTNRVWLLKNTYPKQPNGVWKVGKWLEQVL